MSRLRIVTLCLAAAAAAACGAEQPAERAAPPAAIAVTDDVGREVRLAAPAARVVSLLPAATDAILALDAADRLVARTDYDTHPALAALPSVGGGLTPSIEWLAALRPDLVISWRDAQSRTLVQRLDELGIPVYSANPESVADAERLTRQVGRLLGLDARADSLAASFRAALDDVRQRLDAASAGTPSVLYLISVDPPRAAGPGTFVDELITAAGGRNTFDDARALWPEVSLEEVVRRQPDIVVLGVAGADARTIARLETAPGWREVRAVRAGRVVAVDTDLFNRPGPGLARAVVQLAAILHPDLFSPEPTP